MKAKRAALLGLVVSMFGATASAQLAPTLGGDIGLFTIPSADTPLAGHWTFGAYGWKEQRIAGNLAQSDTDFRYRLYSHWAGEGSVGVGITDNWTIFLSAGEERWQNRGGWQGGAINSIQIFGPFKADEARKIRIGTKYKFVPEGGDSDFRLGLWVAGNIPIGDTSIEKGTQDPDLDHIKSRRTDWEWGIVASKGIFTGGVSYQLSGRHDDDIRVANRLRFAAGVDIPFTPRLHGIAELDRMILDGGDYAEENYSMLALGVRFYFGNSGWAISGAVNSNVDMMIKHGFSPSPVGGIVGVTYAAWPPPPPPPFVVPAPPPSAPVVIEQKTEVVQAPRPPAPPAPTPKFTRDEIFFDAGSARLTNIAKAILDGIALRMKNDLNATAVVTGFSDNAGSEDANMAISAKRAAAAKEYLVTRHGIDPARVTTAAKGSAEPAYDNSTAEGRGKNRRALIVVTLVSGS
jgi:outer membrane protein OmpA-like peptidoglycan-associated protein